LISYIITAYNDARITINGFKTIFDAVLSGDLAPVSFFQIEIFRTVVIGDLKQQSGFSMYIICGVAVMVDQTGRLVKGLF